MCLCAATHIRATAALETNRCKFEAAPRLPQWLLSLDVYAPGITDFQVRRRQKQGRKYCVTTRVSANVNTWLITIWCVFSVEYMSRQSAELHLTQMHSVKASPHFHKLHKNWHFWTNNPSIYMQEMLRNVKCVVLQRVLLLSNNTTMD